MDYLERISPSNNKISEELSSIYTQYGGVSLGIALAESYSRNDENCHTPLAVSIPILDIGRYDPNRISNIAARGFAIKTSGVSESFSPESARGRNSSRNRYWAPMSGVDAYNLVVHLASMLTSDTIALVLQEYITDADPCGIIHCYALEEERIILEHIQDRHTLLVEMQGSSVVHAAISGYVGRVQPTSTGLDVDMISAVVTSMRNFLGFDLDLELFQRKGQVCIVQVRPIPSDVSIDRSVQLRIERLCSVNESWVDVPFFSGLWVHDRVPIGQVDSAVAALIKEEADLGHCPQILDRLRDGKPTLVIDLVGGFRISHSPENLPEDLAMRRHFSYVALSTIDISATSLQGEISFLSSGLRAAVKLPIGS